MEGSFEAPAVKKLKTGEGSGVVVHVVGGEAAGRGGGSSAVASDGRSGTRGAISSGGAGGSQGGGSDAAVGEAEGLDLDVHFVKNEAVPAGPDEEEVEDYSDEEYFSGSDVEVERWTYKSFVKKEEKKLRKEGLDAYMPVRTEVYRCKYHSRKPLDGLRVSLVAHVRAFATRSFDKDGHIDLRDMGRHEALLRVLQPEEYVESDDEELEG